MDILARKLVLVLLSLLLASCAPAQPALRSDPFSRARQPDCVPLPPTPTEDLRPRTPTPNATQIAAHNFPTTVWVSATPLPIAQVIDLSPDAAENDKSHAVVYRCDGTWIEYKFSDLRLDDLPLSPGDTVYLTVPPALMREPPPPPTYPPNPTSAPLPTITPGPSPTSAPITPDHYPPPEEFTPVPPYP
ncbi:MAG TPA: hypothetical protein VMT46_06550 [Anaerolineaceae bacterium]|nr:hypothetical protein [Anaerolineaceae bacterium]